MEWLDLERNAAILEKTDRKIADKLRAKTSADAAATTGGGGGAKSSALKVGARIRKKIFQAKTIMKMSKFFFCPLCVSAGKCGGHSSTRRPREPLIAVLKFVLSLGLHLHVVHKVGCRVSLPSSFCFYP